MTKSLRNQYDVIIIGAGPAGTSLALSMADYGRDVLIIEKTQFPRFHIGESLTGHSAEILESYGLGDYMRQADYPVKHGVKVHGKTDGSKFWVPVQKRNSEGELEDRITWQVRRDEFDHKLLETAKDRGTHYIQASAKEVLGPVDHPTGLCLSMEDGTEKDIHARFIVDASGQNQFLGRKTVLGSATDAGYEKQIAIYAHVENMSVDPAPHHGNTHIFYGETFHWSWSIPQDNQTVSLGIVTPIDRFKASGLGKEDYFLETVKTMNPELSARAKDIKFVSPLRAISNYSYRYSDPIGPGYMAIGDAAGFLDPIFAFGVNIALEEGRLAGQEIEAYLKSDGEHDFAEFQFVVKRARRIMQLVIDTFWQHPLAFLKLAHYSHKDDITEIFSGRFYQDRAANLEAVRLMTELLNKKAA